ncbi:MAG TPA: tetratricopeptide repeat protein [Gemmatimonadales bacterium]|nr:tetratricopeptide repeat protein [Gemmatimonadales bacterium]
MTTERQTSRAWSPAALNAAGIALVALALPMLAVPARAQTPSGGNARVIAAMKKQGGASALPACKEGIAPGGRVQDGLRALQSDKFGEAAQRLAEATKREPENGGAWLYLGRAYLYEGDLAGADSAFTKAEQLAPACKEDILRYRQAAWVPLVNDGVDFVKANQSDSAFVVFRAANTIYRGQPNAFAGLGVIYANRGETDSAITYLKKAVEVAAADSMVEERNNSTLNLGIMETRAKRFDDAIATLERYRTWVPNDTTAAKTLAQAYRAAGKGDKAAALEKQFGIAPTEVPGGDTKDLASKGIALFTAGKFAEAADVFGQVFEKQPFNHDALVNQATAYYKAKDGSHLVEAATKLVALEPLNEIGLELLEQGYKETHQTDKQIATVARRRALPVKIESKGVKISPTSLELSFTATGHEARDDKDKLIKPAPVTLTFEMMGPDGATLATQDVTVPPLKADATQDFTVDAKANGINAWRYKAK